MECPPGLVRKAVRDGNNSPTANNDEAGGHNQIFVMIKVPVPHPLVAVNGEAKPIRLSAGDLIVATRGAHTLRDPLTTPAVNISDLVRGRVAGKEGVIRAGGKGRITRFVCGGVQFESGVANPLLGILPPVLHVRASDSEEPAWLRPTVDHVLMELGGGAGAEEVVTRLTDILFIQAVRWYFEENADSAEFGWLAAARDEQIGRALALLHAHPAKRWTIASLARAVALSRSAFAGKFTELIGEPPLRYLTRLRIHGAARRLSSSDDKVSAIAEAAATNRWQHSPGPLSGTRG